MEKLDLATDAKFEVVLIKLKEFDDSATILERDFKKKQLLVNIAYSKDVPFDKMDLTKTTVNFKVDFDCDETAIVKNNQIFANSHYEGIVKVDAFFC